MFWGIYQYHNILYVNYSTVRVVSHTPSLLFRFGKGPEKGKTTSKFIEYRVCVCVCVCACVRACVCGWVGVWRESNFVEYTFNGHGHFW